MKSALMKTMGITTVQVNDSRMIISTEEVMKYQFFTAARMRAMRS